MHSRIFQLSANPIEEVDYIVESDYYDHWFTNQIADYVDGDCDRDASIEWLKNCSKGYEIIQDNNGNYILVVSRKEKYFENSYDEFMSELQKIGTPTIEQFVSGIDLWRFKNAYEDKFAFYVDLHQEGYGGGLMTFDSFIRHCNVGTKYYVGGVIDYHF